MLLCHEAHVNLFVQECNINLAVLTIRSSYPPFVSAGEKFRTSQYPPQQNGNYCDDPMIGAQQNTDAYQEQDAGEVDYVTDCHA